MEKSKYLSPTLLLIDPDGPGEEEDPYSQNDHGDIPIIINGEDLTEEP